MGPPNIRVFRVEASCYNLIWEKETKSACLPWEKGFNIVIPCIRMWSVGLQLVYSDQSKSVWVSRQHQSGPFRTSSLLLTLNATTIHTDHLWCSLHPHDHDPNDQGQGYTSTLLSNLMPLQFMVTIISDALLITSVICMTLTWIWRSRSSHFCSQLVISVCHLCMPCTTGN